MTTEYIQKFPPKDVNDRLDETFSFAGMGLSANETLEHPVVTPVPTGLIISEPQVQGHKVVVLVEGGEVGVTYTLTCEVDTSLGKHINRKALLTVADL